MDELSSLLRQTREQRGLSLEDVERATHVRIQYLEAIEAGQFYRVPGEVYVKGIIRSYANHLGLDGPALVERYKVLTVPPAEPIAGPQPAVLLAATSRRSTPSTLSALSPAPRRHVAGWLWAAGAIVLLAGAGTYAAQRGHAVPAPPPPVASPSATPPPAVTPPPVTPTPTPTPAVVVVRSAVASTRDRGPVVPVTVSGATELDVQVRARDSVWIQVERGENQVLFSGTLAPGQQQGWQSAAPLRIRVGYPQALVAVINGQTFDPVQNTNNPVWVDLSLQR